MAAWPVFVSVSVELSTWVLPSVQTKASVVLNHMPVQFDSIPCHECRRKDETHEIAQRKLQQMEKLRGAFGIGADVAEGDAFNPEVQEAKRQAERDRREAEKQARRRVAEPPRLFSYGLRACPSPLMRCKLSTQRHDMRSVCEAFAAGCTCSLCLPGPHRPSPCRVSAVICYENLSLVEISDLMLTCRSGRPSARSARRDGRRRRRRGARRRRRRPRRR